MRRNTRIYSEGKENGCIKGKISEKNTFDIAAGEELRCLRQGRNMSFKVCFSLQHMKYSMAQTKQCVGVFEIRQPMVRVLYVSQQAGWSVIPL